MHLLDIQYWRKQHKSSDLEPLTSKEKKIQEARRVFSAFSGLSNIPQDSKDWKTGPNKMFPLVESIIKGITDADDTRQDKGRKVQWKDSDTHKMVVAQRNNAITQASLVPRVSSIPPSTWSRKREAPSSSLPWSSRYLQWRRRVSPAIVLAAPVRVGALSGTFLEPNLHRGRPSAWRMGRARRKRSCTPKRAAPSSLA